MKTLFFFIALCFSFQISAAIWPGEKPKLIVLVVIDQFRADYLSRYQHRFSENGFKALMKNGAYFPYGEYDVLQSMTGPGHATTLTGAYPYQMGIPINDWYDQKTQSSAYCVEDRDSFLIGSSGKMSGPGISPKNLRGTTVGDEFKNADFQAKTVSIALKDRAAVLMGGHRADLALWFDSDSKQWISSKYYLPSEKLPAWVDQLNSKNKNAKCDLATSCGLDKTFEAFEAALENEKLGRAAGTDILAVSFSSHDYAGHKHGPNASIMLDMTLAEDRILAQMRQLISKKVTGGLSKTLIVLTGDHGVSSAPDYLQSHGIDSDELDENQLIDEMSNALNKKYGKLKSGKWIPYSSDFNFYLNESVIADLKLPMDDVQKEMKTLLLKKPGFAHVVTQTEYDLGIFPPGIFERQLRKTYYRGRSGHVIGILQPFYISKSKNKANHMTGYSYDRTVPLLFSGFGIKNGVYAEKAEVVDVAPTLSFLLGTIPPALSEGRVLKEALLPKK